MGIFLRVISSGHVLSMFGHDCPLAVSRTGAWAVPLRAALLHLQGPVHPSCTHSVSVRGRTVVLLEGWSRVAAILLLHLPSPNQKGLGAEGQVSQSSFHSRHMQGQCHIL
jgi:hypothetical protein